MLEHAHGRSAVHEREVEPVPHRLTSSSSVGSALAARTKIRAILAMKLAIPAKAVPYLEVAPLAIVLLFFFVVPMAMVLVASFFDYNMTGIIPTFTLTNYIDLLTSRTTLELYLETLKFALIVWAITLVLGFTIAYFLAFHVRNPLIAIGLLLLCTVPFWTSDIIRMISWIPLLGKYGVFNRALIDSASSTVPCNGCCFPTSLSWSPMFIC